MHCIKGIPQEERTAEQAARPKRAPIKDTESIMGLIALREKEEARLLRTAAGLEG